MAEKVSAGIPPLERCLPPGDTRLRARSRSLRRFSFYRWARGRRPSLAVVRRRCLLACARLPRRKYMSLSKAQSSQARVLACARQPIRRRRPIHMWDLSLRGIRMGSSGQAVTRGASTALISGIPMRSPTQSTRRPTPFPLGAVTTGEITPGARLMRVRSRDSLPAGAYAFRQRLSCP
jgi:hypothetical protein